MFSLTTPISSEAGDKSFQNNVPDPVTSRKELPIFKFELSKSEGRVIDGSYGKEATLEPLPISKAIAGVSMRMQPDDARTALARDGGGMGVHHRRRVAHDGHRPGRPLRARCASCTGAPARANGNMS